MTEALKNRNEFLKTINTYKSQIAERLKALNWQEESNFAEIITDSITNLADSYKEIGDGYYFYGSILGNLIIEYSLKLVEEKIASLDRIKRKSLFSATFSNLTKSDDSLYGYWNICSFFEDEKVFLDQEILMNIIVDGALNLVQEGEEPPVIDYLSEVTKDLLFIKSTDEAFSILTDVTDILYDIPEFQSALLKDADEYEKVLQKKKENTNQQG